MFRENLGHKKAPEGAFGISDDDAFFSSCIS